MAIWTKEDVIQEEMAAYDDLPYPVRQFLANHDKNIPATRILEVFKEHHFDEQKLWQWINRIKILQKT